MDNTITLMLAVLDNLGVMTEQEASKLAKEAKGMTLPDGYDAARTLVKNAFKKFDIKDTPTKLTKDLEKELDEAKEKLSTVVKELDKTKLKLEFLVGLKKDASKKPENIVPKPIVIKKTVKNVDVDNSSEATVK